MFVRTRTVVLSLALFAAPLAPRTLAGDDLPARTFSFAYEVRVPKPTDGSKRLEVWVPLPVEDDLQAVSDLRVSAASGGKDLAVERTAEETYGNRMAHVAVDDPPAEVVVRWTATIRRTADTGQAGGAVLDRYRQPDRLIPTDGRAAALAKELGATDLAVAVRERAKRIYDHVLTTMQYDKVAPGWGQGDFERACAVGKGNCTDFHAKFIGIGRAAAIPVRFTMGIPLSKEPEGKAAGYHCWAHFRDGDRWVPVDISEAQKASAKDPGKAQWFFGHLDPDRVSLSTGRDVTLAPRQKGPPLLHFAYPYVEVDGNPVDLPPETRSFSWKDA